MPRLTHLAVALAAADTRVALAQAHTLAQTATLIEYRLDLMGDFDLRALLAESPLPAIITCRPPHEGGQFAGSEQERRQILREAIALNAPYVDVEWDTLAAFADVSRPNTRLIGSHHDFAGMIGDWAGIGASIRALGADIVKLVGTASSLDDVLTPLAWLHGLDSPGIGIAMGLDGVATRLLAPRFPQAFLSFAAFGQGTAPSQVSALEMAEKFGFQKIAPADPLIVLLTPPAVPWDAVEIYRQQLPPDASTHILPLPVTEFGPGLLQALELARAHTLICLPEVKRAPSLVDYGLNPAGSVWRIASRPFIPQPALIQE